MSSKQIVFVKASCFRKQNRVKHTLENFAKNFGKLDSVEVIKIETLHEGDEVHLNLVEALISFTSVVNLAKVPFKFANLTLLEKRTMPRYNMENLKTMSGKYLMDDDLDKIKHDLESALRLYEVRDFADSAALFGKIIKMAPEDDSLFALVLVYCHCLALLNSRKMDNIHNGYEMLLNYIKIGKFPLYYYLLNKYERVLRKDKTCPKSCVRINHLAKWPFFDLFANVFQESDPIQALKMIKEDKMDKINARIAMCRYSQCQDCFNAQPNSSWMTWSRCIIEDDIDYRGFVRILCENRCKIDYHNYCWKSRKSEAGEKNDKDFLYMVCDTPDCNGKVKEILRFGEVPYTKPKRIQRSKNSQEQFTPKMEKIESKISLPNEVENDQKVKQLNEDLDNLSEQLIEKFEEILRFGEVPYTKPKLIQWFENSQAKEDQFTPKMEKTESKIPLQMEVENDQRVKELNEKLEKLSDQLKQAQNEAKAANENRKHSEELLVQKEEIWIRSQAEIKDLKQKIKRMESDQRQKSEKRERELIQKSNLVIIELCKAIQTKYLDKNEKFAAFVTNIQNMNHPSMSLINYKEAMKKTESILGSILEVIRGFFPSFTEQELLGLILEVKKNNNGSIKHMTMNRIISEIKTLIVNSVLDAECGICLEVINDMFVMPCCKKKTCKRCINHWQETKRDCPFCRRYIIMEEDFPKLK